MDIEELEPRINCVEANISESQMSKEFGEISGSGSDTDILDISRNYFDNFSEENSDLCKSPSSSNNRNNKSDR